MTLDLGAVARRLDTSAAGIGPVEWADRRGLTLWSGQRAIADAVTGNRRVAVRSAHSVGKSWTAAMLAGWWIDTHPAGDALVITTAPSHEQVHGVLWHEIRALHSSLGLPGEVQQTDRWKLGGRQVGLGRRPPDYQESSFQGLHRRYVLVVLDEAAGIPAWLWTAAEAVTTSEGCRLLAIGNPTDPASEFARVCQPGSGWHTMRISAFDTPGFTGEAVPARLGELLVSPAWVEDRRVQWGESSPLWLARVLGEFPHVDEFAVVRLAWVEEANARWRDWRADPSSVDTRDRRVLGVDVARFGSDDTAIATRQGDVVEGVEYSAQRDTTEVADLVDARLGRTPGTAVVDVIGVGVGVLDMLRRRGRSVEAFTASERTNMRDGSGAFGFPTTRSAAWWNVRELLDPARDATLALPDDDRLTGDLIAPSWREVAGARLAVEGKDEVRRRLGRSSDAADACIMACWSRSGGPGGSSFTPWSDARGVEVVRWAVDDMFAHVLGCWGATMGVTRCRCGIP